MEEKKKLVEIQSKLTNRSVNEGFSGGEKKKNEIFQMAMLEPSLAILDEFFRDDHRDREEDSERAQIRQASVW